jgi:hypothetical protein
MFKQIEGFSLYSINNEGQILNNSTGKIIKPWVSRGSLVVSLVNDLGARIDRVVVKLVKQHFPTLPNIELQNNVIRDAGIYSDLPKTLNMLQITLRRDFYYDPYTGEFFRKQKESKYYGFISKYGYRLYMYKGVIVPAHLLIFWFMLGHKLAKGVVVDHVDHNKTNLKWDNLRLVTHAGNAQNQSKTKRTTYTNITGISYCKKKKKYIARIMVNRTSLYLGAFENLEDAVKVREQALTKYNFHPNHGK